jgi:hypothetical protein
MGLASVVKAAVAKGTIKRVINEQYKEKRNAPPVTDIGFLRASGFASLCPREEVLRAILKRPRPEEFSADTMMTFLHGKALHWGIQNDLLPTVGILIGRWTCLDCGTEVGNGSKIPESLAPRPKKCPKCGGFEFMYRELQLRDEELHIQGHNDGFLVIPGLPGVGILEAKSIGKGWEVRNCPSMDHVVQAHIYMMLTGLKWARILYWEKGAQGVEALIEHHVDRDDETVTKIRSIAKAIWSGIADQNYPDRICTTDKAPRAMKCVVCKECFEKPVGLDL